MTASDLARRQRRTTGFSVGLLLVAALGLAFALSAIGEEVLMMPERRKEAEEIEARLPELREERNLLIKAIAKQKAELSVQRTAAEEARTTASRLPGLQAEETRTRAERERLTREIVAVTSNRDTLQGMVDLLTGQRTSFEDQITSLVSRNEAERERLDEVRQSANDWRTKLAQVKDALGRVNTNEHSHAILFRWNSPKLNTNASRHASRSSAAM